MVSEMLQSLIYDTSEFLNVIATSLCTTPGVGRVKLGKMHIWDELCCPCFWWNYSIMFVFDFNVYMLCVWGPKHMILFSKWLAFYVWSQTYDVQPCIALHRRYSIFFCVDSPLSTGGQYTPGVSVHWVEMVVIGCAHFILVAKCCTLSHWVMLCGLPKFYILNRPSLQWNVFHIGVFIPQSSTDSLKRSEADLWCHNWIKCSSAHVIFVVIVLNDVILEL